jgi:hypothetical protein
MPQYEGYVAGITGDGKAEVVIKPGMAGIPNAPEVSKKVCHRATNGSTLRIEAVNKVGARVGDWVRLSQESGMPIKNAAMLLGIPVLGAASGLVVGAIFTDGFVVNLTAAAFFTAVGLLLGTIIGVVTYRRMSTDKEPIISRVIRTRTEMPSVSDGPHSPSPDEDGGQGFS